MTDAASCPHFDGTVHEPLGDDRAGLRIGLIVFDCELEAHRLSGDPCTAFVERIDCHLRAVQIVLAVVRLRPGKG